MSPLCPLCMRFADPDNPLVICRTRWSVLSHMPGIDLPGYLLLSPVRHAEDAGQLTRDEQVDMATLQARAVQTILGLPEVRKVYLASFGEAVPHLHLHLFPRTEAMAKDPDALTEGVLDGPRIFDLWRKRLAVEQTPEGVLSLLPRLREALAPPHPSSRP